MTTPTVESCMYCQLDFHKVNFPIKKYNLTRITQDFSCPLPIINSSSSPKVMTVLTSKTIGQLLFKKIYLCDWNSKNIFFCVQSLNHIWEICAIIACNVSLFLLRALEQHFPINLCNDRNFLYSALSDMVDTSHIWLLST